MTYLDIALAEVGYLEKRSNADLDDKTKNAGYNNWTKYGRDMTEQVGAPFTRNAAWCCTFVQWCVKRARGSEALKALGGWTAYCPTAVNNYRRMGKWHTSPEVGDQIFFKDANGVACHTGLVYKVDSLYVYTVEGNTSSASGVVANGGAVAKKVYKKDYAKIMGYGGIDMTGEEIYNALNEYLRSLPAPDWALAEIEEAKAMGITDGTRPMELIPRYQAAIMAKRAAKK